MPPLGTPARHRAPPQIRACGQNQSQLDIFGFSLDGEDMALIDTLDAPGHYSIHPDHLSEE